jgi:5-hydroxyisourate hydrolase
MKRVSTHVLDVHRGKPASGVAVRLERQEGGGWQVLKSAKTDLDGRCSQLLNGDELPAGLYRVVFDTVSYFDALQVETLYSNVEVNFRVREGDSQFHLPLLLSANGYTTYRGS